MLQSSLKHLRLGLSVVAIPDRLMASARFGGAPETALLSRTCRWVSATTTLKESYEYVQIDTTHRDKGVGVITLNRPKALNALCDALFVDLIHAATALDQDDAYGCLVLTGAGKAFAAGADIAEMKDRTFDYAYQKVRDERLIFYFQIADMPCMNLISFLRLLRICFKNGLTLPKCPSQSLPP
jgi:1,4-dihydroxy-2-naphthoyl-CoA synthase